MDEAGEVAKDVPGNVAQAVFTDVQRFEAVELEEGGVRNGFWKNTIGAQNKEYFLDH